MKFTLTINTDNAAFEEDRCEELAGLLRDVARRITRYHANTYNEANTMGFSFAVRDRSGNTIGRAELLSDDSDEERS